jgi:hypothetical protein
MLHAECSHSEHNCGLSSGIVAHDHEPVPAPERLPKNGGNALRTDMSDRAKPPDGAWRIARALKAVAARHDRHPGAIRPNEHLASIVRRSVRAARGRNRTSSSGCVRMGRKEAEDFVRFLFEANVLIRVSPDTAGGEELIMFDYERMERLVRERDACAENSVNADAPVSGVPSVPADNGDEPDETSEPEEQPVLSMDKENVSADAPASGPVQLVTEDDVRDSDQPSEDERDSGQTSAQEPPPLSVREAAMIFAGASKTEAFVGGGDVQNVIRDPLEALVSAHPSAPRGLLASFVERAVIEGFLLEIGTGIWRVRINPDAPDSLSASATIGQAIKRLEEKRDGVKAHLDQTEKRRSRARFEAQSELDRALMLSAESDHRYAQDENAATLALLRGESVSRTAERILEERKAFKQRIAFIKEEERRRLANDERATEEDFEKRMQIVESGIRERELASRARFEERQKELDQEALERARLSLEELEQEIARLKHIQDQTS